VAEFAAKLNTLAGAPADAATERVLVAEAARVCSGDTSLHAAKLVRARRRGGGCQQRGRLKA
jgi:hypothetical protein